MRMAMPLGFVLFLGCTDGRERGAKPAADEPAAGSRPSTPEWVEPSFPSHIAAGSDDCRHCGVGSDDRCTRTFRFGCRDGGNCGKQVPCDDTCCEAAREAALRSVAVLAPGARIFATAQGDAKAVATLAKDGAGLLVRRGSAEESPWPVVETVAPIPTECAAASSRALERLELSFVVSAADLSPATRECAAKVLEQRGEVTVPVGNAGDANKHLEPWTDVVWNDPDLTRAGRSIGPIAISADVELQLRAFDHACFPMPGGVEGSLCASAAKIVSSGE